MSITQSPATLAARALRAIPSDARTAQSRANGAKGGRPRVYTVMDYQTGAELDGRASRGLVDASRDAIGDTGAVPARLNDLGIWVYVRPDEADEETVTVWVHGA